MKTTCLFPYIALLGGALHAGEPTRYFDPDDRRVHAAVDLHIAGGRVQLSVAARGAAVEPLPGFRGRSGSNLQTAFEIDQLIAGDRLEMITTDALGKRMPSGEIIPGMKGRIPIRRLRSDGRIEYNARSAKAYLLGFTAASRPLGEGAYRTELWARGEPRLRMDYRIDASGTGIVLAFVELGHRAEHPARVGEQFQFVATDEPAYGIPVDLAAWRARDLSAKWLLFKKQLDEQPDLAPWVAFLLKEKDYRFLEFMAMHQVDAYQPQGIGAKLKQADAPQWIRLAVWMREGERGHLGMVSDGLLLDEKTKDTVASWIRKQPKLAEGTLKGVLTNLDKMKAAEVDVSRYLPPHDPAVVFKLLQPPKQLAALGEALRAEAGTVYVEQVMNAIDALIVSGRKDDPWMGPFDALRAHPHPRVRQAVFLGYTHFKTRLPADTMDVVRNEHEVGIVREAALMAHSYRKPFEAYPDLIEVAKDPGHPAWRAAISRLVDIGDGYALTRIMGIELNSEENQAHLKDSRQDLKNRLDTLATSDPTTLVRQALQHYAWMHAIAHPHAGAYQEWMDGEIPRHIDSIQFKIAKVTGMSFKPGKNASGERKARFVKMNASYQRLAARYIK